MSYKPTYKSSQKLPAEPNKRVRYLTVDEHADSQRLDNFLQKQLKGAPKSLIYRIIRRGEVRVNKGRAKPDTRVQHGDQVRIPPLKLANSKNKPVSGHQFSFLDDAVLFEDETILVMNKPSGLAVHAGSGIAAGLIEGLRARREDLAYLELAHRLDRETSGCLVLAKKAAALRAMNCAFAGNDAAKKRVDKRYLALVKGRWRYQTRRVIKPLDTEARRGGERHVRVAENGSYACSLMRPVQRGVLASLIEVQLRTGRTHQARVHACAEGHPIAGDSRYGDAEFNRRMKQNYRLNRLFLHAFRLTFNHPTSGQRLTLEAPLPDDLQQILARLPLDAP